MGFIDFVRSRQFWINVLVAGILIFLMVKVTMFGLKKYTHWGESILVPDLIGLNVQQAADTLKADSLNYAVVDSSYFPNKPSGIVLDQDPDSGQNVKEGRRIYLTITRRTPPPVEMPDLIDVTLEFARKKLQNAGLVIGEIKYRPGLGKNKILEQLLKGKSVPAGKQIPKGSRIDLVLADGLGETKGEIPNLIGLTFDQAKWTLNAYNFNIGYVEWDKTVKKDSTSAVIWKQVPEYDPNEPVELNFGEAIDIYLTKELPDFLKQFSVDSMKNND